MKYLLLSMVFLFQFGVYAQKDCVYSTNIKDSIGTYKVTTDYMVHERNFAGKTNYIFFSLMSADGTPMLKLQQIEKSTDFIKANCFNASSKLYLQLDNGKVITMLHTNDESCGTMVNIKEENKYSRFLSGTFMFLKGTMEDLKTSPVSLIRIKYATETVDYVLKKQLVSELTKETYQPETYFMKYLKCIE